MTDFLTKKKYVHWKEKEFITDQTYKKLLCTDGILPRIYALPKVHESDCPFRITSFLDSSLYPLAFLYKIIARKSSKLASHIENSFQLIQKLQDTVLDK